jgi:hypothetical protein
MIKAFLLKSVPVLDRVTRKTNVQKASQEFVNKIPSSRPYRQANKCCMGPIFCTVMQRARIVQILARA